MAAGRVKPSETENDVTATVTETPAKVVAESKAKNPIWVNLSALSTATDPVHGAQLRKGVLVRCAEGVCFIPSGHIEDRDGKLTVI